MDLEALLKHALDRGEEGDWEGMARELANALESYPDEPAVLCWLGVAEREMGLEGSAYDRFKDALAQAPEDPHILATVGNGLARFDDPDAEAALRSASILAPELPLARWMFGAYLSREGLFQEALKELSAASELAPQDPTVTYETGVALALSRRLEEAADVLLQAVDLDPGDGWNQVVLGLVEAELGRMEEAARDLSEGARIRPEDTEAQFLACLAAASAGLQDLAYEMLERGRNVATEGDLPMVDLAERRLDQGAEASRRFLTDELLPGALRERLMYRP